MGEVVADSPLSSVTTAGQPGAVAAAFSPLPGLGTQDTPGSPSF